MLAFTLCFQKGRRKETIISRNKLPSGIALCLRKSDDLLADAEVLLGNSCAKRAAVLFSYAIEEFGKAAILWEAAAAGEQATSVTLTGFSNHQAKLEKAETYIPKEEMRLVGGGFQRGAFQANAFQVDVIADLETRLRSLWTDWDDERKDWTPEIAVDSKLLANNITAVRKRVQAKMGEWIS